MYCSFEIVVVVVILVMIFVYLLNIEYEILIQHITDIMNMRLPFHEQLHWFLLNSGWRSAIIRDMSALSDYSVVIVGMVKDAEEALPNVLYQMKIKMLT